MALTSAPGSGGSLTYEQVLSVLVQPLTQRAKFLAAGPRIVDANGNPIRLPKLMTSVAPSWHGEAESIDEVDATFDGVTLLDRDLKSLKSIIPVPNELLRASVIPLEAALRDRLVYDQAIKVDAAMFAGTGGTPAGSEPLGMLSWDGTTEIDLEGAALTFDDVHDAVGTAEAAYADPKVIFMSPARLTYFRKEQDDYGRYQMSLNPADGNRSTLLGLPIVTTTFVGDNIVVADMDQVVVGRDRAEVRILDQTYGDSDQTGVRVISRYDVAPLNAEGVVVITGAEALAA